MSVRERKQREKEQLRQTILDVAGEMFAKEGFENVSLRKIADRIEYSPTTIYLYFKDKAELFECLVEETFTTFLESQNKALGENRLTDPLDSLRRGMRAYIDFGLTYPNHYRLIFMTPPLNAEATVYLEEGTTGWDCYCILRTLIQACIEQKLLPPLDLELLTQTIWSINHGITALLITCLNFPWADREKLIAQVIETAVQGLRSQMKE